MKVVKGNLITMALDGEFDVIVHGCNCFCAMGAGIAREIKNRLRSAYIADMMTTRGDRSKLGKCSEAEIYIDGRVLVVVNAYTQYRYNGRTPDIDYMALESAFKYIKMKFAGKRIGIPKIGAGLAGGDWARISEIIERELDGEDITLVEYYNS